jgi:hypothetical protein
MFRIVSLALLLFCPFWVLGQFSDDFSDGDFTSNPTWVGDTDKFIVENAVLRLNDNQAGQAYLATQSTVIDDTQWEFWIRLAFTPSNNNHPKIYLVSDSQDLHGALNGYFIRIGKDGGDNKRIYFYRQDGTTAVELMAGASNLATGTNNMIRIRALRDDAGNWEFWADPAGGRLFIPQGDVTDNTHTSTNWFGVHCTYTVSNANRFYFDDFYVGDIIPDTAPPQVNFINVVSANTLDVHFSKVVETVSAEKVTNYFVNRGIGAPLVANRNPQSPNIVRLLFAGTFEENLLHELHIMNVEDYNGNVIAPFIGEFVLYRATRFDVVFNELMVDPTPEVALPPYEYIELYNTTDFPINIEGWILQHAATQRLLPFGEIPPRGYIVLTTETAFPHLQHFGNVVAVPGLSGTALTNAGATLLLFDQDEQLVSFVSYTDQWYQNPAKANGGWSLEKIDPYNFCQGRANWRASEDPRGGTPGEPNSIMGNNPDTTRPRLVRAGFVDESAITLFFSEPMDEFTLLPTEHYMLMPENQDAGQNWDSTPVAVEPLMPDFSMVRLHFAQPMEQGIIYKVTAGNPITDCAGNALDGNSARVAIPQPADSLDMVINEVLFNAPTGGVRYIEFYNRSQNKVIDLKDHIISSKDTVQNFLTTIREISQESFLFFPGTYVVVTPNPELVKQHYMTNNPDGFIRTDGFPSMTNTSGVVVLAKKSHQIIDMFAYHENMHLPLLTSRSGVALERLNPNRPTQDRSNWHSAAQNVGFGTPAYRNSQYTADLVVQEDPIEIYPEVFSPDGDGHDDLLNIGYTFAEPGYVANISIFDSRGRLIRRLKQGELLATTGVITWDGTTDDFQKAPIGIYIIHVEVFDVNGNVRNYRKTAVLGGRL